MLLILVVIITPIVAEVLRRLGARRMSGPRLIAEHWSVGDEDGHRKWNIQIRNTRKIGV